MRLLLTLFVLTLSLNIFAIELKDYDSKVAHHLVEKEGALLLDVRTLIEYKINSLKNSKRIHVGDLEQKISEVKKMNGNSFEKPIVVFCASGGRSSRAKEILIKHGFKKVVNLGGINAW
jgi:rhodanese-related sulfurtransferase